MRYLLALLLPPLAILLCGKLIQFTLNLILCIISVMTLLVLWPLPVIHALLVVHSHLADKRIKRLVRAVEEKE